MGDPKPDIYAIAEELIPQGRARWVGTMLEILPPTDEEGLLEMRRRESEAHIAYNTRFSEIKAEDAVEIRKAEARIARENLRY